MEKLKGGIYAYRGIDRVEVVGFDVDDDGTEWNLIRYPGESKATEWVITEELVESK